MKHDSNPSIIFGLYCQPEKYEELKKALSKQKLNMRELRFIDVEIPLDRYDETINFFKHFVMCEYWSERSPLNREGFIINKIKEQIAKSTEYTPITFKTGDWKQDNKHPLLFSLAVPLFYQDTSRFCTTKQEEECFKKIKTFSSDGYKPKITGLYDDNGKPLKEY